MVFYLQLKYGEVTYDYETETYYLRRKIEDQTIELGMNIVWWGDNSPTWLNIYITLFSKKKHMWTNMDNKVITGKNPFKTFSVAHDMFYEVESAVLQRELLEGNSEEVIIYCTWVDNRRRDAYYKVLARHGYDWGQTPEHEKCIMKKFTINDINPAILEAILDEEEEEEYDY